MLNEKMFKKLSSTVNVELKSKQQHIEKGKASEEIPDLPFQRVVYTIPSGTVTAISAENSSRC